MMCMLILFTLPFIHLLPLTHYNIVCTLAGARPEKLVVFEEKCWDLMQQCWEGDPAKRPLLGDVEPRLMEIMNIDSKKLKEEKEKTKEQVSKDQPEEPNVQECTIDSAIDATEQMGCLG